ncbi:MAG TPA: UpxY family transcription antiterminator [Puia sp.]|jgi:transcription antitermination factor NusG|nr:UpxY family transcription antiterminator [Puia sp.]
MSANNVKWYVVYTKPRWEKKVHTLLVNRGIESYCPLNRTRKKWSDRIKWVDEPLFKSYVFVRIPDSDQLDVRMVNGVVNFVYWLGKPAIVRDEEIAIIRKFLNEYTDVSTEALTIRPDARVRVQQGVLMNKVAKVLKVQGNKVCVVLESIGYSLIASVKKSNLVPIEKDI